jgi:enoyl-CoA hydratase/carnithine racemase
VVPKERLLARATEIAEMILENGPLAVWGTKQGIWEGYGLPLDQAEILTEGHLLRVSVSEDHQEGPRAFAKKTKPQWKAK